MTSVLGALWTGLQSIGWLLYFLRQLISDTLDINYRLVSSLGHIIAGITKAVYMVLSLASLAVYEGISYVLLTISGIILFTADCLSFVVHCCTLLSKVIYYIVSGLANGLFFVAVTPLFACQTVHSWVLWIFNTERWLNAAVWCLQMCSSALALAGENAWSLILYSVTIVSYWMDTFATFTYEHVTLLCSTAYNGLFLLSTLAVEAALVPLYQFWSLIAQFPNSVHGCILVLLVNPLHGLMDLCDASYLCLISISLTVLLTVLVILFMHSGRLMWLIPSFLRHSTGEVIRINFDDMDVIDVSDDEQDYLPGHAANVFGFAGNDEDMEEEEEDTDVDESDMGESTEEESDNGGIITDSDVDDSDAETIDVQLPDQLNTAFLGGRHHGYATRSKSNVDQLQQRLDQERERNLCVICQDQVKSVLVLPCRHMCMCVSCARTVVSGRHNDRRICPLCRGNIRVVMNVYT